MAPEEDTPDVQTSTRVVEFSGGVGHLILGDATVTGVAVLDDAGQVSDVRSFDAAVVVKVFADVGDGTHSVQVTTPL